MTIIIRSVFEEDDILYPQVFLDDPLYKLSIQKCCNTTEFIFQKVLMLIKQVCRKNAIFVNIGFKHEPYLSNGCYNLMQKAMNLNNVAIVYVK